MTWIDVKGRKEHEALLKDEAKMIEMGLDPHYERIVYLKRWGGYLNCDKILLFLGNNYYPAGGWDDFKGYFEDIESAKKWVQENEVDAFTKWAHLVYMDKIILYGCGKFKEYYTFDKPSEWIWEEIDKQS